MFQVLFKMDHQGHGLLVCRSELSSSMGISSHLFTFDKFRYMCILSGCDYLPSLPGIGLGKACKVFQKVRCDDVEFVLRKLPQFLNSKSLEVPSEYIEGFIRANNVFLYQVVYDPLTRKQVSLTELSPDLSVIDLHYAGNYTHNERLALELALGNIDFYSMKRIDQFNVNDFKRLHASKNPGGQHSMWDPDYRPVGQFDDERCKHPWLMAGNESNDDKRGREVMVDNPYPSQGLHPQTSSTTVSSGPKHLKLPRGLAHHNVVKEVASTKGREIVRSRFFTSEALSEIKASQQTGGSEAMMSEAGSSTVTSSSLSEVMSEPGSSTITSFSEVMSEAASSMVTSSVSCTREGDISLVSYSESSGSGRDDDDVLLASYASSTSRTVFSKVEGQYGEARRRSVFSVLDGGRVKMGINHLDSLLGDGGDTNIVRGRPCISSSSSRVEKVTEVAKSSKITHSLAKRHSAPAVTSANKKDLFAGFKSSPASSSSSASQTASGKKPARSSVVSGMMERFAFKRKRTDENKISSGGSKKVCDGSESDDLSTPPPSQVSPARSGNVLSPKN